MELSRHNVIAELKGTGNYYIVNVLSGSADLLTAAEAKKLEQGIIENSELLIERGYLVDIKEEEKKYRKAYLNFLDDRESDEVQIFYVPTYACNFGCSYCYQSDYSPSSNGKEALKVLDAFYKYIDREFAGRKRYLTLFGGEPLLASESMRQHNKKFFTMARERNIEVAVVTNGYHLKEYLDILQIARLREIQVTLDGLANWHDKRRPLKGGGATFETIVDGIDGALDRGLPINLRMVVDRENIQELPALAQFAIDKGWTASHLFKTQLGRNYELHSCQDERSRLFTRLELFEQLHSMIKESPEILEFHRPAFSIARFLFDNGQMPSPLFDACPGCKTEWAFDYTGSIYSCTATVGKSDEKLGTFYPHVNLDDQKVSSWEDRDVLSIEKCKQCSMQLMCGGGCGSVAKNTNGSLHSTDCRPVKEMLALGIDLYAPVEKGLEK